jgi:4,5-DOPA dioxygenase extradiol
MRRRDLMKAALGSTLGAGAVGCEARVDAPAGAAPAASGKMPAIFAAHGAPILLDDLDWVTELGAWARALPPPKAVLVVSAHWVTRPIALGATTPAQLVYDFSGFPEQYYQQQYAAPGAPELAKRVRDLIVRSGREVGEDPDRGLDHGAYVPLVAMYPNADVPVLQLSLPGLEPQDALAVGRALAPLREEGVLVFGSGFLTHNMRMVGRPETPDWAREFDLWAKGRISSGDLDALVDFRAKAPAASLALPTHEHYTPLLVAMDAAEGAQASFPIEGFWMGSFTKRSVQLG